MKNPELSIIIVHYKIKEDLLNCINSLYKNIHNVSFEIIVVDNSEQGNLEKELKSKFKSIKYIKSQNNLGYSGGNNLGAREASGEYLFFLNPDTQIIKLDLKKILTFFSKDKKTGIVAPLLVGTDNKLLPQGGKILTPLNGIVKFSFLDKILSNFKISKEFWSTNIEEKEFNKVDVIPGTAFIIKKDLFEKISGFDEQFFLYFEEFDICKRVKELGFKIYINSSSKILHKWGRSTKNYPKIDTIFRKSRFKYFKKHYGLLSALFVETFLGINKVSFLLGFAIILSLVLRLYNLSNGMIFIGDQGWFYLSARDLLVNGNIPLVGITSSHLWLHQGPLWTYMLSGVFLLFYFDPLSGAYLTATLGVLSVFLIYIVGREFFSKEAGLIGALLYSCSSLVIISDRMPFDPAPIPLFTFLYFFVIIKWLKGKTIYFPFIFLLLGILYNLELATFSLFFPFAMIVAYGILKKKDYIKRVLNKKIILYSLIALIFPMFPVIIYDFHNGFNQTVVFLGWTLYKPFSFFFKGSVGNLGASFSLVLNFLSINLQNLLFTKNLLIAFALFSLSFIYLCLEAFKTKKIEVENPKFVLLLFLVLSLAGILVNQTPSDAYLPILFPFVFLTVGIFLSFVLKIKRIKYLIVVFIILVVASNAYSSYKNDLSDSYKQRNDASDKIISLANGQEYNLIGKGPGSQFRSFTMNYEYLLWYKGHPVSEKPVKLKIIVIEGGSQIIVQKSILSQN